MDKFDLELLAANLKNANASQAAKKNLLKLSETVREDCIKAFLSNDPARKDAVLIANMTLIGFLIDNEIKMIDMTAKLGLDITGVISEIKKEIDKTDNDTQGGKVVD